MRSTRRTFFFCLMTNCPEGARFTALTVTDVASRYKEAEPLNSNNSDEVAQAFQKIYRRSSGPKMLQVDPVREFMGAVTKEMENRKTYIHRGRTTRLSLNVSTAPWLSACSATNTLWKCGSLRVSGPRRRRKGFLKLLLL